MKKSLFFIFAVWFAIFGVGCSEKFDDTSIWDKLNSLETRVAALEQLCRQMNTNITSLQTIVEALQNKDYITNIAPINEEGKVIGYTMTFSKSGSVTIYNGKDGQTPSVGVKKDVDNLYYWTLNGEWLLDEDGNKIKAEGVDGDNGLNGIAPKLKIEDDYWYVSYDNGTTWTKLDKATGKDGDSMFSQITYDDDNVYFTLTDGTKLVIPRRPQQSLNNEICNNEIWYTSVDGKIVVPNSATAFNSVLLSNTYHGDKGILKFDADVTSIEHQAFKSCANLVSVTLPNTIVTIGESAFEDCLGLHTIQLSESLKEIKSGAFKKCSSLRFINIPNGITEINNETFLGCRKMLSITIPNSVTSIGDDAFYGCSSLQQLSIPSSVTSIGDDVFCGCTGELVIDCIIRDAYNNADGIFNNAKFSSVIIGNNPTFIGYKAFYGCDSIKYIVIGDNVKEIHREAFYGCTSLEYINIPNGVTLIGHSSFYRCDNLYNLFIPYSVSDIRAEAFFNYKGVLTIDCNVPSADYSYTSIYGGVYTSCFKGCISKEIIIGDNSEKIGDYAFNGLNVTSVTIGTNIKEISRNAFADCRLLKEVYSKAIVPPAGSSQMFYGNASGRKIYVPIESVETYKSASFWNDYASDIVGYDFGE